MLAEVRARTSHRSPFVEKPDRWEDFRIRVSILCGRSTPCHGSIFGDQHGLAVRKKTPFIRYLSAGKNVHIQPVDLMLDGLNDEG